MERMTYVMGNGTVLFTPPDYPEDLGETLGNLAAEGEYEFLDQVAERLANREQLCELYQNIGTPEEFRELKEAESKLNKHYDGRISLSRFVDCHLGVLSGKEKLIGWLILTNEDTAEYRILKDKDTPKKFVSPANQEGYKCPHCNFDLGFDDDYFGDLETTRYCKNCGQRLCK